MLGTLRINLTFQVAEVQDTAGNSMFVLHRAVLDYLCPRRPKRCAWFGGPGHLAFLDADEWASVQEAADAAKLDIMPFDGVWHLSDDPECVEMDVYEWADECCKAQHPRGKVRIS
jgi:hypothetical protein